jgi:hypothetical protein
MDNSTLQIIIGILGAVVALDHALAAIKSINANSTFQLLTRGLQAIFGVLSKMAGTPPAS